MQNCTHFLFLLTTVCKSLFQCISSLFHCTIPLLLLHFLSMFFFYFTFFSYFYSLLLLHYFLYTGGTSLGFCIINRQVLLALSFYFQSKLSCCFLFSCESPYQPFHFSHCEGLLCIYVCICMFCMWFPSFCCVIRFLYLISHGLIDVSMGFASPPIPFQGMTFAIDKGTKLCSFCIRRRQDLQRFIHTHIQAFNEKCIFWINLTSFQIFGITLSLELRLR